MLSTVSGPVLVGDLTVAGEDLALSGTGISTTGALLSAAGSNTWQAVGGTGNQPITMDLSAAAGNGQLNRSYDGSVLTFDGLDSGINNGTYVPPATPTGSANRVIAVAGSNPSAANFLNTTTYGPFYVGDDNRGSIAESATGPIWRAAAAASSALIASASSGRGTP